MKIKTMEGRTLRKNVEPKCVINPYAYAGIESKGIKIEIILSSINGGDSGFYNMTEQYKLKVLISAKNFIEKYFNIENNSLHKKSRLKEIIIPRHIFSYGLSKVYGVYKIHLGGYLDLDHSTICNSINKVEDLITYDYNTQVYVSDYIGELIKGMTELIKNHYE